MKFLILLATLILSFAIEIERRKTKQPTTELRSPRPTRTYLQRFRTSRTHYVLVRLFQVVVALLTVAEGMAAFWGPFWPTEPKIEFHDTVNASTVILPFKVTNRSVGFALNNMHILCFVDLFYFMDADRVTGLFRDGGFDPGPISIDRDSVNNYPCTASDFVSLKNDGALVIGVEGGRFLETPPGAFRGPLTVLKMCLQMSGEYPSWISQKRFETKIFQWPAVPGQNQWIEGPVTPDLPNEVWVPENSHIGYVWDVGRQLATKSGYLPWALQCTRF